MDVCVVVRFVNGMWMPDPQKAFCSYPFNIPQYGVCFNGGTSRTLTYRLRSNDDPFIVLQYLTQGSGSFGLTEGQQRALGTGLVAVGGIILAALLIAPLVLLRNSFSCNFGSPFASRSAFVAYTPVAVVATNNVPETAAPLTGNVECELRQHPAADPPYPGPIQSI